MHRIPLVLALLVLVIVPGNAEAKRRRITFFPQDLDMENPGHVEMDTRIGFLRTADGNNLVIPDIQTDWGINRRLEIGLDGQGGLDTAGNWTAQDQLWLSAKHLLWDGHRHDQSLALGLQHGIRFAVIPNTWAFGYQAVGLFSVTQNLWQVVLSVGAYVDPPEMETNHRPIGALAGLDATYNLNDDWDIAPSVACAVHGEGNVDIVLTTDLELDLGVWGSVRAGVLGGWQDSQRLVGGEIGYAPRFKWLKHQRER